MLRFWYVFFFISISLSLSCFAEVERVKVQPYVRVFDSEPITLLTLVETDQLPKHIQNQLRKIKLSGAPQFGEKIEYSNVAIAQAIRQSRIQKSWNIQIPYEVVVENKGYEFDRDTVEKQLMNKWTAQCGECELKVRQLQLPKMAPDHELKPWSLSIDDKLPRGHFSAQVIVSVNDNKKMSYWVNGQLEVYKKVPVLIRSTPMNTRLTEEDFKFEKRNVTMATDSVPTAKEIIGQRAKFTMNAGDIIWNQSLLREKAVLRGEIVRLSVDEDNWSVSIQAQTQQDGYIGDTVNVRNLQTNRVITGRVVDHGRVVLK